MRSWGRFEEGAVLVVILALFPMPLAAQGDGFTLVDTPNLTVIAKNIEQKDEDGDSQLGVGLDYKYSYEKSFAAAPLQAGINGSGYISLNDPNSGRSEASRAANFNSIINEGRITIEDWPWRQKLVPFTEPLPTPAPGESNADFQARKEEYKRQTHEHRMANNRRSALYYLGLDGGLHARSESDQGFDDTQFALGGELTVASAWLMNNLLCPFEGLCITNLLVPADPDDPAGVGKLVQSPQVFAAIEAVLNADHRREMDGVTDESFARFRFELAWKTEMLINGLWPFVNYHLYQDLSSGNAIERAGKRTADFLQVGASYYIGALGDGLAGAIGALANEERGPFITVRYATGELPPYLESDNQLSLGFGIDF